ncbi:MAG: hypothetical protein AMJ90_03135 [candidate division Zixibacteria bacterium SM23_73_2]|nr:MAG: hypothetical protein AMJ90_03135 [candidate division Zixibacteria bacterium SM23_73_2]
MQALREIRRRIRTVQNTQQITKAMKMVAAARLKKAQSNVESSRPYAKKLDLLLKNLSRAKTSFYHPLFEKREKIKKTLLFLITSDRGLCGPFNANIFKEAKSFLEDYEKDQVGLVIVGKKGFNHFRREKWEIVQSYPGLEGKVTASQLKSITNILIELFLSNKYDQVYTLYTQFLNPATFKVTLEKFLNIEPENKEKKLQIDYIFEPNVEEIFDVLLPRYCINRVQMALFESFASEHGSRMTAMSAATKNAEEMIEELTLIRNKLRQAAITKEMLEIASGAEALKG